MACKCIKCGKPCDYGDKYCPTCFPSYLREWLDKLHGGGEEAKEETVYERNLKCGRFS